MLAQAREQGVSLVGPGGLLPGLTRQVLETALEAELTDHLGHENGQARGRTCATAPGRRHSLAMPQRLPRLSVKPPRLSDAGSGFLRWLPVSESDLWVMECCDARVLLSGAASSMITASLLR